MQYFKSEAISKGKIRGNKRTGRTEREKTKQYALKSRDFNDTCKNKAYFFISNVREEADYESDEPLPCDSSEKRNYTVKIGIICRDASELDKLLSDYLTELKLERSDASVEEITLENLNNMLKKAEMNDYVEDAYDVLSCFGLDALTRGYHGSLAFNENVIKSVAKEEIYGEAERYFARDAFISELDRIYSGSKQEKVSGHPVHYFIQTDDVDIRKSMCKNLLSALYENGRLNNRRYAFIDVDSDENIRKYGYEALYKSCDGGAILVRYNAGMDKEEDSHADISIETIETLCEMMKLYRNKVLTVFCLPRECARAKAMFFEHFGSTSLVEISEELATGEQAESFLKMIAEDNRITADNKLFEKIEEGKGYASKELRELFNEWYDNKLKTGIFPQYKEIAKASSLVIKKAPKGSAYEELMRMVGLDAAKDVINKALKYYKAQKLFKDKGLKEDRPAMHMIFTGNPGTAKTSVARLVAEILKENGILSYGKLIEVGRGDLVGKYVGWTAPTVKRKFREAVGSVLFIDEAYSLVDDRDGSFGDEAINTIVQEMENHRDDVVVIFAGYPDKMKSFLDKNPGLRSRIAFHVPFEDYSSEELCGIAGLIAEKKGLVFEENAREKLMTVFDMARVNEDFGNGRYARNVVEKAKMAQLSRILTLDFDSIGKKELETIRAEDIELPIETEKDKLRKIGFCA